MRQALSSTQRGYDLLAPKFDLTPFRTPRELLEQMRPYFDAPRAALDVCCGTGAVMEVLRPLCSERLVGIDFSEGMLEVGRQRLAALEGTAQVEWVYGNVLRMPFEREFELVTCFGSFGHILRPDQSMFLAGIYRALRPGGRFVFVTSYRPPLWSRAFWVYRSFDAIMWIRNQLWRPPFVMYYLMFLLPRVAGQLQQAGFAVTLRPGLLPKPYQRLVVVEATRPS
jgi:ubiquinone/menaquinone biosynthesis C-methylase UbiE